MSAAPTPTRKPQSAFARWALRLLFAFLGVLGVGAIGTWITISFGGVSGVELCPQTFERRAFVYYEVPLIGWKVSKVYRTDMTGKTEEYLATNKLVPKKPKGPVTWHIVQATRGRRSWAGDAQILVNYFEAEDSDEKPIWLEWSSANPKLAGVLWPAISQLAIDELYIYVPEVIALAEKAEDAKDAASFPKALKDRLGETYFAAAVRCQQAENHEAAVLYLDQALKYSPQKPEYLKAKKASQEAMGTDSAKSAQSTSAKP